MEDGIKDFINERVDALAEGFFPLRIALSGKV